MTEDELRVGTNPLPDRLLEEYLDGLEEGLDDAELLGALRNLTDADRTSVHYQLALIARSLFYYGRVKPRLSRVKQRIVRALQDGNREDWPSVWAYFDWLMARSGVTWSALLRQLGLDPRQAGHIKEGRSPLTAVLRPPRLARAGKILGAEPAKLFRAAYKELVQGQRPTASWQLLREAPGMWNMAAFLVEKRDKTDASEAMDYLAQLEDAVRAEFG
ncbi:MAG: hypothetical protein ACOY3F_02810 [Bacillota bacterium]